jgi:glycosyltransferase involved in cell wall biosynthesis
MKIAINGRFLTQGITGVQRYAQELVQAIDSILEARPDLKVTVISPRLSKPPPPWQNVVLREGGHLQGHAWEQLELPWLSRGTLLFCPGNTAPVASLLGLQRVIVTVHDLSYKYFPGAYSRAFRLLYGIVVPLVLRHAAAVITVSETERVAIASHYPAALLRLHAIQNGGLPAGLNLFADGGTDENRGYVLYVGSLSKRKNFPGVLEAACRLARKRGFHFVVVGGTAGGIYESSLTIPDDVHPHITFAGQIDDTTALMHFYRNAACLLFPSHYESSGLPPIEAMACGCPVIASDIPALRERCGDAAIYCNPRDIGSITDAIERVMDDSPLRSSLMDLGYQQAAKYTWEHCAMETLKLICRD